MKQLDEYTYLITDLNIAIGKLDSASSIDYTPVQDEPIRPLQPQLPVGAFNLMDALSEPTPSTSKGHKTPCCNQYPSEKPLHKKIPKEDQLLIAFSSSSCSSESVPMSKSEKEIQCKLPDEVKRLTLDDSGPALDECKLPAQSLLQIDHEYHGTIMHVDGLSLWIITDDIDDVCELFKQMTIYYKNHVTELNLNELMSLTYCAIYDIETDCFYRALFIKLSEEDMSVVEVFLVDTGETKCITTDTIQPLYPMFCNKPPFARCCHLAGLDLLGLLNRGVLDKQEEFVKQFLGKQCSIRIDDNSSESLDVYVTIETGETLNDLLVQMGLAIKIDKTNSSFESARGLPELSESKFDITQCPEYDDPVEAVTGYHNRDEMDICKHYKGGPEKTCFKGARCTKKHIMKHPDGWTLDKVSVLVKCKPHPLPAPGTWQRVYVTHIAHFNRFYVHFLDDKKTEIDHAPSFGVVLPPANLNSLILDMNCPATRIAYKPLKMMPAPGELVAALYPLDEQWYRARVISATKPDQNVEVFYIDYGNVVWVKEDCIRELEPRFCSLEAQASRCALAGVTARTSDSKQWVAARQALTQLIHEHTLQAQIIARDYDEVTVELFDESGYSIAEQLAAGGHVTLTEYSIVDDTAVRHKLVVP